MASSSFVAAEQRCSLLLLPLLARVTLFVHPVHITPQTTAAADPPPSLCSRARPPPPPAPRLEPPATSLDAVPEPPPRSVDHAARTFADCKLRRRPSTVTQASQPRPLLAVYPHCPPRRRAAEHRIEWPRSTAEWRTPTRRASSRRQAPMPPAALNTPLTCSADPDRTARRGGPQGPDQEEKG